MKKAGYFLILIFILFCISCAATPDVHLKVPGTNMELTRRAQLAMRLAVSAKNNLVLVGSTDHSFNLWDISTGQKLKSFRMSSSFIGATGIVHLGQTSGKCSFSGIDSANRESLSDWEKHNKNCFKIMRLAQQYH